MKIIPRFSHGAADYLCGLFLLLAPNLLDFAHSGGAAAWVTRIIGLFVLSQAMMTDYELGLMRIIAIDVHLMTDYLVGVSLMASPWFFGFSAVRVPMITVTVVGLVVLGLTAMTQRARGLGKVVMAYPKCSPSRDWRAGT